MTNSLASTLRTGCLAIPIGPRNRRVINAVATVEAQTIPLVQNLLLTRPSQRISMLNRDRPRARCRVYSSYSSHAQKDNKSQDRSSKNKILTCNFCGLPGHVRRDCRKEKRMFQEHGENWYGAVPLMEFAHNNSF